MEIVYMYDEPCDFVGCDHKATAAFGLCHGHYKQAAAGRPLRPLRRYTKHDKPVTEALNDYHNKQEQHTNLSSTH